MLLGEPAPELDVGAPTHVRNEIGRFNEVWVASMADVAAGRRAGPVPGAHGPPARRARGRWTRGRGEAEGFTPAGKDTYGRFMRIRAFDCWLHEQDIRDAVRCPGGEDGPAAELALEEMTSAMGYVVGKRAGAPPGSRVVFDLTGPLARRVFVEVGKAEGSRAAVVDELSGPPTVSLSMPVGVFARLAGGRVDPAARRDQVDIEGDVELGRRILNNLAYTM